MPAMLSWGVRKSIAPMGRSYKARFGAWKVQRPGGHGYPRRIDRRLWARVTPAVRL